MTRHTNSLGFPENDDLHGDNDEYGNVDDDADGRLMMIRHTNSLGFP